MVWFECPVDARAVGSAVFKQKSGVMGQVPMGLDLRVISDLKMSNN